MVTNYKKAFFYIALVVLFFINFSISKAETDYINQGIAGSLQVDIDPELPKPEQLVTVKLTSYTPLDINSSDVKIFNNGALIKSGKGLREFTFNAPQAGKTSVIKISITTSAGVNVERVYKITPADVSLLWSSNSTVPPFYKGIPLYTQQNNIELVAVPSFIVEGKAIPSKDLVFKWKKNSEVLQDQSGRGKSSVSVPGNFLGRDMEVSVEVTSPDHGMTGTESLVFEPMESQVILYEKNPIFGTMWNKAIPNLLSIKANEVAVEAEPFYFNKNDFLNNLLSYNWNIGYTEYPELKTKKIIVLKPKTSDTGQTQVSVTINNSGHLLQEAHAGVGINLNQ